jgi:hypothetical protein
VLRAGQSMHVSAPSIGCSGPLGYRLDRRRPRGQIHHLALLRPGERGKPSLGRPGSAEKENQKRKSGSPGRTLKRVRQLLKLTDKMFLGLETRRLARIVVTRRILLRHAIGQILVIILLRWRSCLASPYCGGDNAALVGMGDRIHKASRRTSTSSIANPMSDLPADGSPSRQ